MNRKTVLALLSFTLIMCVMCAAAFFKVLSYPKQLTCSDCEKLLNDHEESFELIVEIANLYLLQHYNFHASFDENGAIDIDSQLRKNEALISALNDIRSDDMLTNNPFSVSAGTRMDGSVSIRFYLYESRSTYAGIEYREVDTYAWPKDYEQRIDEHWFFYARPMF